MEQLDISQCYLCRSQKPCETSKNGSKIRECHLVTYTTPFSISMVYAILHETQKEKKRNNQLLIIHVC